MLLTIFFFFDSSLLRFLLVTQSRTLQLQNLSFHVVPGPLFTLLPEVLSEVEHLPLQEISEDSGPTLAKRLLWDVRVLLADLSRVSLII